MMRTHQSTEKDIMLGITAGARKNWKPHMRWTDDTGRSVNDIKQFVQDRKKVALIIEQHSQEEKMDQCLIQGEGNDKPLL